MTKYAQSYKTASGEHQGHSTETLFFKKSWPLRIPVFETYRDYMTKMNSFKLSRLQQPSLVQQLIDITPDSVRVNKKGFSLLLGLIKPSVLTQKCIRKSCSSNLQLN